jgi:hypothetical protein
MCIPNRGLDRLLAKVARHRDPMRTLPPQLLAIAASQFGLLRRAQALGFISEDVLARLVGPHGRWQIVIRGVYATFTGELTPQQQLYAGLLYVGGETALTSVAGCRLHRMRQLPDVQVLRWLIAHTRQRQSREFVKVERTRFMPRAVLIGAIPVAPLVRCVMDAARELRDLNEVRDVMMEAVQRRRTPISWLQEELERGPMPGSARPRLVINELIVGARAVSEAELVALLSSSRSLPPVHYNCTLLTPEGDFLAVPDAYIKRAGVAGEIQSLEHHLDSAAQESDMARRATLGRYDVHTIEARPSRVRTDGAGLLADFEVTCAERSARGVRARVLLRCRPECPHRYESDVGGVTP